MLYDTLYTEYKFITLKCNKITYYLHRIHCYNNYFDIISKHVLVTIKKTWPSNSIYLRRKIQMQINKSYIINNFHGTKYMIQFLFLLKSHIFFKIYLNTSYYKFILNIFDIKLFFKFNKLFIKIFKCCRIRN